jgi:hypothetical protein
LQEARRSDTETRLAPAEDSALAAALFSASAALANDPVDLLRQETLALDSGPVDCTVIEAGLPRNGSIRNSPYTYWIDVSQSLIRKLEYSYTVAS